MIHFRLVSFLLCIVAFEHHYCQKIIQNLSEANKTELYSENKVNSGSFWPQINEFSDSLRFKANRNMKVSLWKQYLISVKDSNQSFFQITPLLNICGGIEKMKDTSISLFQNTRGIHIKGNFLDKIFFETGFLENQARFTSWESNYYKTLGEKVITEDANGLIKTTTINASIPGGARTKPFKIDGFDFAFAWGQVVFKPLKIIEVKIGNSPQFIGPGKRSQLLSDNAVVAPFIGGKINFTKFISYSIQITKLNDLTRRRFYSTVEAPFQKKTMLFHYLCFELSKKWNFSLFDALVQKREENNRSLTPSWQVAMPLPVIGTISANNEKNHFALLGYNLEFRPKKWILWYSQGTIQGTKLLDKSLQLGTRLFFQLGKFQFSQLFEANLYSKQHQINEVVYAHANIPLTGIQSTGFHELIANGKMTYKMLFAHYHVSLFLDKEKVNKFNAQAEFGVCWNNSNNASLFSRVTLRQAKDLLQSDQQINKGMSFQIGVRATILNQYSTF